MSKSQKSHGEVNWEDVEVNTSTGGTRFLQIKESQEVRVRVVSKPYQYYTHWVEDSTKARRKVNCALEGCPVCEDTGKGPQTKWFVKVLHKEEDGSKSVKVLDAGAQIFGQLRALHDDDEWGPVHNYDVKIIRGKKGSNPLYKVNPCKPSAFTEDEKDLLRKAKDVNDSGYIDLVSMCEPWSIEKINKVLHGEDDSPTPPKEVNNFEEPEASTDKKASTKKAKEDDEDFLDLD